MHEAEQKGLTCELWISAMLTEAGIVPSFPMSRCKYDLVADNGTRLYRIQVKKALFIEADSSKRINRERDRYFVALDGGGGGGHKRYSIGAFDYLAVFCTNSLIYFIPAKELEIDGRMLKQFSIKPPELLQNTRADSLKASRRWEQYRNNTNFV